MRDLIRIDDAGAKRCKGIGDGRFAASNASGQADQCSVVHNTTDRQRKPVICARGSPRYKTTIPAPAR